MMKTHNGFRCPTQGAVCSICHVVSHKLCVVFLAMDRSFVFRTLILTRPNLLHRLSPRPCTAYHEPSRARSCHAPSVAVAPGTGFCLRFSIMCLAAFLLTTETPASPVSGHANERHPGRGGGHVGRLNNSHLPGLRKFQTDLFYSRRHLPPQ